MNKKQHGAGYRDDITGLRALAVIVVCAYHFGLPGWGGGFGGVGVFFVISGFVITKMIRTEVMDTGTFNFARFYLRRVRRLLPALIATVAASFVAGALLLSPQEFQAGAESAFGALLSFSNVLFWRESGYFDASAITKPLLHTWSLSVEEQFYLVWPAIVVLSLAWARGRAFLIIAGLGLVSFAANFLISAEVVEWVRGISSRLASYLGKGAPTIFFLTPFRVFEFAIGALAVWSVGRKAPTWVADLGVVLGLGIVGYCALTYAEQMLFPSYNALLPCFGTWLILRLGGSSRVASVTLENRAAVKLGEMSYAVYLVHWPLVVYLEKLDLGFPQPVKIAVLAILTLGLGFALHELVEKRFRTPRATQETLVGRFGFVSATAVGLVLLPAATVAADGGWPWRIPVEVREIMATEARVAEETIESHNTDRPYDHAFSEDGRRQLLIIGDSMANDMSLAVRLGGWTDRVDLEVLNVSYTCLTVRAERWKIPDYQFDADRAHACDGEVDAVLASPLIRQADVVVLTHNWYDWVREDDLAATFEELRQLTDKPVYVIGKRRWFEPKISAQILKRSTMAYADADAFRYRESGEINAAVQHAAEGANLNYVTWDDLLCDQRAQKCFAVVDQHLLYRDAVHFTLDGARIFGERMAQVPTFASIMTGHL